MSITSADLLSLARQLRDSSDEVERRASTSRLYYGLLHRAVECLQTFDRQLQRPREATFRWVRERFLEVSSDHWHLLNALARLKDERQHADYDIDRYNGWSQRYIELAEEMAREVARLLDEYVVPAGSRPALGLIEPAP